MSSKQEIDAFAQKYNLFEGKHADFYNLHGSWALTKKGAEKVAATEGITFDDVKCDTFPVGIAYRAKFQMPAHGSTMDEPIMDEVQVVGSCRWDQAKPPSPESTHAPEMAWKRMYVRGVIALVAPSLLHGEDEFTDAFRKQGQQPDHGPPMTTATQPPQTAPRSNGTASYNEPTNAPSGDLQAHAQRMQGVQGWFNGAEKLPHEWGGVMGRFCELTGLERGQWELVLMDHGGKYQPEGKPWWKPSSKYPRFVDMVMATSDWGGVVKSKAVSALKAKQEVEKLINELDATGRATVSIPDPNNPNALIEREVTKRDMSRATTESQPTALGDQIQQEFGGGAPQPTNDFPDDVPF